MVHTLANVDPEKVSNAQLFAILIGVRAELIATRSEIQTTAEEIVKVQEEFCKYRQAQKEMMETWNTARGVLKFIKFLAAIGLPITVILTLLGLRVSDKI